MTGGPFTPEERDGILDYCWTDIVATRALLDAIRSKLPVDLDRCHYRGRYAVAATLSMRAGIPIDTQTWYRFLAEREQIQQQIAKGYSVYEGATFKQEPFGPFLETLGLRDIWPRTETGLSATSDKAFRDLSYIPAIEQLRQARAVIDQLREPSFQVHRGRNYYSILPFKCESSRNSTIGCIYQAPTWLRGLIQPRPGRVLVQLDFEQEEFFIAGVLANDQAVLEAYASGDPYTPFGIAAGLIPPGGTKHTCPQ